MAECRFLMGLLVVSMLAACSPAGSATPPVPPSTTLPAGPSAVTAAPSMPMPTSAPTPVAFLPAASPTLSPRPSPTSTASTAAPPVTFKPGQIAIVTATDGVRMRTDPGLDSGSDRYTPMLPKGTDLYIISGPKHGSGYHWYEVSPISFRVTGIVEWPNTIVEPESSGYVAVASREGEAWLRPGKATCPKAPQDVIALASLTIGARLGCFSGVPITLQTRLLPENCDVTWGGEFRPPWFQEGFEGLKLAPATAATVPQELGCDTDVLFLHLDPRGAHPVKLPVDKVVTVTGMFDHPAAASCKFREWDGSNAFEPTEACRSMFAVTSIR